MKKILPFVILISLVTLSGCSSQKEEVLMSYVTGAQVASTESNEGIICGEGLFYTFYDFINKGEYGPAFQLIDTTKTFEEFQKEYQDIKRVDIINDIQDKGNGHYRFKIALLSSNGSVGEYVIEKVLSGCTFQNITSRKLDKPGFYQNIDEICSTSGDMRRFKYDQNNAYRMLVYQDSLIVSLYKTGDQIYYSSFDKDNADCDPTATEYIKYYNCTTKEHKILLQEAAVCYGITKILYPENINKIYTSRTIADGCGVPENNIITDSKKQKIDFTSFENYSKIALRYTKKDKTAQPSCRFDTQGENVDLQNVKLQCRYGLEYDAPLKNGEEICGKIIEFTADIITKTIK